MPRRPRGPAGTCPYHVFNRAVRRAPLFENDSEYAEFEVLLRQILQREPNRLLAYCAMRTHWHLVLWPTETTNLPRFMHRLATCHAWYWHQRRGTRGTGPVYQNRYKCVPIESDEHLVTTLRYVERNPLDAGLVQRAEEWRWCSLWLRRHYCAQALLSEWPVPIPSDWLESLNRR